MRVIATKKGYDGERRIDEGVIFDLKEKEGLNSKGDKVVFTVEQQFSKKWMKEYKGKSLNVKVEGDFDPETEEVIVVPKSKKKKSASDLEVI